MSQYRHPDEWEPQGVESLECNAWEVVRSTGHQSVVAGPGSGKTELLAQRATYLLQTGGCPNPRRILAISFKFDAAKALRERVASRCDSELAGRFDSLTFDAFCTNTLVRCRGALPAWCQPDAEFEPILKNIKRELDDHLRDRSNFEGHEALYDQVQRLERMEFYEDYVLAQIPRSGFAMETLRGKLAASWWRELLDGSPSRLTFPMISRLVEFLYRENTALRNALRSTYSHVFMDEFQDTTPWQYDLVHTAFFDTDAVITAVGDHKQSIMGWAGAIPEPFKKFENDLGAQPQRLYSNYRSSEKLVRLQHDLAKLVDPNAQKANSMVPVEVDGDVCAIWSFKNVVDEAEGIASYVCAHKGDDLMGDDFAIIVKQKAADFTSALQPAFEEKGLKVRDESQLQNVLSQRLTEILLSFLRFGAMQPPGATWRECYKVLEHLEGLSHLDDASKHRNLQEKLAAFHDKLSEKMERGLPNTKIETDTLLKLIVNFLDKGRIQGRHPEYSRDSDFNKWYEKVVEQLAPVLKRHSDWGTALDEFMGVDTTPVMTIHKSKGLEYHTVFFVGLEDETWWSIRRNEEESLRAFFVGFTRAKQRVIFTNCKARSQTRDVDDLYYLFKKAGVKESTF